MAQRFTATYIKSLKPKNSRYYVSDDKTKGLYIAVYPSGNKRFYYRKWVSGSRDIFQQSLGDTSVISIKDAREAATVTAGRFAIDPSKRKKKHKKHKNIDKSDLELFKYVDKYYASYAKSESVTADAIIRTIKREFEFLSKKPIHKINGNDIDKWRKKRVNDIVFSTMQRAYASLRACIYTAVHHYKLINKFELQKYRLKRKIEERVNPPVVRFLSLSEERDLLNALQRRDNGLREKRKKYVKWLSQRKTKRQKVELFSEKDFPDHITPIVRLAYLTGFDLGDIFDFDWQGNIDFSNKQIRKIRNKTKHKQNNPELIIVPITEEIGGILHQWGEQHGMKGRMFKSPVTGGRLDNIDSAWRSIMKAAKIENFRFKDLRHTFASWLAIGGADLITIRDLLGHKDIKTTQIYAHLCREKIEQTVQNIFSKDRGLIAV